MLIAVYFCLPVRNIAFRKYKVFASSVAVPEAAVDEDGSAVFGEDNVGSTRKSLYVDSVTETLRKQVFAHNKLGFCILAFYALHAFAPLLWIQLV